MELTRRVRRLERQALLALLLSEFPDLPVSEAESQADDLLRLAPQNPLRAFFEISAEVCAMTDEELLQFLGDDSHP